MRHEHQIMRHEHQIDRYTNWLQQTRGLRFDPTTPAGYDALWRWSTTDLRAFWQSIWDYHDVQSPTPHDTVLVESVMPGARWFPGAQVNYVRQVMRHADRAHAAGHPAIVFQDEAMRASGAASETSWPELRRQVASFAAELEAMGVKPGDRVAAVLPNTPHAAVAFLACASLGAIWSVCSPDMGPVAVLDRFRQIEPVLLIAVDGYRWAGVAHERVALVAQLVAELPTLKHVVLLPRLDASRDPASVGAPHVATHRFDTLTEGRHGLAEPRDLPFDHPLWIVYSSGTTGLPKAIVHGHGGVMLEALKMAGLHFDLGASASTGERFHWFSTTGWIMWNCQMNGLLLGTTIALFDGNPGGPAGAPDWTTLWRFAADAGVTWFGAGAAFYASCLKADVHPMRAADLSRARAIGSTGSPLAPECYEWIWQRLPKTDGADIWIAPVSGGTDFAGGFIGGLPTLPVVKGEMACRCLGAAVHAFGEPDAKGIGQPLVDAVGELVCTEPMPSMPLRFWNDPGGRRLHESYFDMYRHPDGRPIWRHGDWLRITPDGGAVIYGRSDATINRYGVRMGTAELYRAVEAQPEVLDSLVVDLEYLGRESYMPLFVVLREGVALDDALVRRLRDAIKSALSPRHVPNEILQVPAVPRTLSGKKMELPVKKLLLGHPADQVLNPDAMANADSVAWFVDFARRRASA
jgi:acetoacetyl-CoA synthetase